MITWSEIEAEAGDYRDGFVAIFRKYEGMETDEKDAYGRVVKVTQASFARHFGIPVSTFADWVKMITSIGTISRTREQRIASRARSAVRNEPEQVAQAIAELPEVQREKIVDAITDATYGRGTAQRREEIYDHDRAVRAQQREDRERNAGLEHETEIKLILDRMATAGQYNNILRVIDYAQGLVAGQDVSQLTPEMFQ